MKQFLHTHYKLILTVLLLAAIGYGLYLVPPAELVALLGVENVYLVAFLIALCAGVSSFTGTAALATVGALAHGGADPILLGLIGGLGLFLSDTIFYFVLRIGSASLREHGGSGFARLTKIFQSVPPWLGLCIVYLYTGLSPFPNDLLMLALLIAGYRYRVFALPLLLGAITLMLLVTQVGGLWA